MKNPPKTAINIAVCTALDVFSSSLAPMNFPNTTFAPTLIPINILTSKLINALVDPTAASA